MNIKPLKLFNTFSREVEDFKSIKPGKAQVYCCGPTVYDYQHIGNFKTFIIENLLVRALKHAGYQVDFVMNITDVGHLASDADEGPDKMLVAAERENKKSYEIAEFYTNHFFQDWDKLGLIRPDTVCKATDHIQEMIDLIKRLEEKDYAYFSNGNVYFDVMKFEEYGKLALLNLDDLKAGARIEVDPNKRHPLDFVLWFTKSKFDKHELLWDSPWGEGYPGWHIECSAMSMKYLGESFDIHCGGIDHIPVHHTNEIAQSEAATGKKWVNFWVHSEFILLNNEKMSKSKGGFITLDDLIEQGYHPLTYKMLCLGTHYRKQVNFSKESMDNAARNLEKLFKAVNALKASGVSPASNLSEQAQSLSDNFTAAILNDLNTPQVLAIIWQTIDEQTINDQEKLNLLYQFDQVLGFDLENYQEQALEIPDEVVKLLEERQTARDNKDWQRSDQLRDEIATLGFKVIDSEGKQEVEAC